jgi:hypothetical protein
MRIRLANRGAEAPAHVLMARAAPRAYDSPVGTGAMPSILAGGP